MPAREDTKADVKKEVRSQPMQPAATQLQQPLEASGEEKQKQEPNNSTVIDKNRLDMYHRISDKLWAGRQASFEAFDKSILTLSSGALVLSVAFMKDVVPVEHLIGFRYLVVSWVCFISSILITLSSFFVSQRAFDFQLKKAQDYYLKNDEEAHGRVNPSGEWVDRLNKISGALFIVGFALTIWFASTNILNEREIKTQTKESAATIEKAKGGSITKNPE